jgi:alpha-tubulin suppressor-like RCC1 family protein
LGLSGIIAVATRHRHSLALSSDGHVWAWGWNLTGQLGDGTTTSRPTAALISSLSGVTRIAAGWDHNLAVLTDGTVRSWGANGNGQLGDGTTSNRLTPVAALGLSNVSGVAAGQAHSIALTTDGAVWTWGANGSGQIGDGTITGRLTPAAVTGISGASDVAAGYQQSLAVTSSGVVWAWGGNTNAELGDGTLVARPSPVSLCESSLTWKVATPAVNLAAGTYFANQTVTLSAVTAGATIHYTLDGLDPTEASPVVSSGVVVNRSLVLKARAWKAGMPPSNTSATSYVLQAVVPSFSPGTGTYSTARLVTINESTDGAVVRYTFDGSDPTDTSPVYAGWLSIGTATTLRARAFKSDWSPSVVATAIYSFNYGTLATPVLTPPGGVYTNDVTVTISAGTGVVRYTVNGTEPNATSTLYTGPIVVTTGTTLKAKAFHIDWTTSATATATYTLKAATPALLPASGTYDASQPVTVTSATSNAVLRYSLNGSAPTTTDPVTPSPLNLSIGGYTLKVIAERTGYAPSDVASATYAVTGASGLGAVAAGETHSLLLRPDGTAWSWGANGNGQLGDGTTSQRTLPAIIGLTGIRALAGGAAHSVALTWDGRVRAWGHNGSGQVGDGSTTQRPLPTLVALTDVIAVAAGQYHTLAVRTDGTVWAWGANSYGQLGDGTTTQRNAPVQVPNLTGIVAVAGGNTHSLALGSDGRIWGWGANGSGQVGDGTTTQRLLPTLVSGISTATQVVAGAMHSLALLPDGTVRSWGSNASGQLGDGTTTQRTAPVAVQGLASVVRMAGRQTHSLAVKSDGSVWAWGGNGNGQIGDGTTTQRVLPGVVPSVAGVTAVAAGTAHSLAVSADGIVWSWGGNGSGQLGDGTTQQRPLAGGIGSSGWSWNVAAPTVSVAPGTYFSTQTVTLSTVTAGATIRYSTNGVDPTETAAIASGPIVIDRNLVLKARAWKTGLTPSDISTSEYVLQPQAPALTPAGGLFAAAQSVSVSEGTTGATVHVTLDGTEPTEASPVYSSPLTVSTATIVRAKAFKPLWAPSATTSATFSFNYGTLPAPSATPGSGTYTNDVTVTCGVPPGSVVRYTTNGAEPDEASPACTTSLLVTGSTTLKVKAFQHDWVASSTTVLAYTLRVATPTFDLPAGAYPRGQRLTIGTSTQGATIHYTISGTPPTADSPTLGTGESLAVGRYTLMAFAVRAGYASSDVAVAQYSLSTASVTPMVASGDRHSLALQADGTLWAWGENSFGQLGDGTLTERLLAVRVEGITGVKAVAGGGSHTLALTDDGRVWTWGLNEHGELGDGTTVSRALPTPVPNLQGVVAIAAGQYHSLAVKADGTLWAWGANSVGQLGVGSAASRSTPGQVPGLSGIVAAAGGSLHSMAMGGDGRVWTWGDNTCGQLGDGSTVPHSEPTVIAAISGAVGIAAGRLHSLAVLGDGGVVAWGQNADGQLGTGTTVAQTLPTGIAGLSGVVMIAAGESHTMAVTSDGHVWIWGGNGSGQLGDGTTAARSAPYQMPSVASVVWVSAGTSHSAALASDGTVWTWGANGAGQLGDGTTTQRLGPVAISQGGLGRSAVALVSPYPGTAFPAPGPILLLASANVANGWISAVEFRVDGEIVATVTTPPYGTLWTAGQAGNHEALAVVIDNAGARTMSEAVSFSLAQAPTGQLGAPIMSPPGGVFATTQMVTMRAAEGATVRFTTDGTAPDETSTLYVAPVSVDTALTLRARAFQLGWSASTEVVATFEFDYVGPNIHSLALPAANSAGWNKTPVNVTYRCSDAGSGVTSCPETEDVSVDGEFVIGGTARDAAGNTSSVSRTVKVDLTSPELVITSPADNATVTGSTTSVVATVIDNLSGVATATCDGTPAAIDNGQFSCEVALRPGRNFVDVRVTDVAGNSASTVLQVGREAGVSSLSIAPAHVGMAVGQRQQLRLVDQLGFAVTGAQWESTAPAAVAVQEVEGVVAVVGRAVGTTTVTATAGTLNASATVTVYAALPLPTGSLEGHIGPLPGNTAEGVIVPNQVEPDVPDLYVLEKDSNESYVLRSADVRGQTGDAWNLPAGTQGAGADRAGGVLVSHVEDESGWVMRIPGGSTGRPWSYHGGPGTRIVGQSVDGTVYLQDDLGFVGIDGTTGAQRFRYVPPGHNTWERYNLDCFRGDDDVSDVPPSAHYPVVAYDGSLYFLVNHQSSFDNYLPCGHRSMYASQSIDLVRVTSGGAATTFPVAQKENAAGTYTGLSGFPLVPDERGGVHVMWSDGDGGTSIRRLGEGVSSPAVQGQISYTHVGDGVGFDDSGTAYDLDTGAVKYEAPTGSVFVASTPGGGEAVSDGVSFFELDATGSILRQTPIAALSAVGASFLGGALWATADGTGASLETGPGASTYGYEFPDGARKQPKNPKIATIVPYESDASDGTEIEHTTQWIENFSPRLGQYAEDWVSLQFLIHPRSKATRFVEIAEKGSAQAVAFIGHSVSTDAPPANGLAYGLAFSANPREPGEPEPATPEPVFLVKEMFPQLTGDRYPADDPRSGKTDLVRPYLWTNAQIIFLGACDLTLGPGLDHGRILDMMWYTPGPQGMRSAPQALIYAWNPIGGKVHLAAAKQAWNVIVRGLLWGETVGQAVYDANQALKDIRINNEAITDEILYWGNPATRLRWH